MQQFVDPQVSRRKFEREIEEFNSMETDYRRKGWLMISSEFPRVLVAMCAPHMKPQAVVAGVLLDYTNYDALPPSVRFVDPFTLEPYPFKNIPIKLIHIVSEEIVQLPGMAVTQQFQQHQDYIQAHSAEDIPFFCVAGVLEYHRHPAHTGDAWEIHRSAGAGRLVRLLDIIYRNGIEALAYQVNLVPQISFAVPPDRILK